METSAGLTEEAAGETGGTLDVEEVAGGPVVLVEAWAGRAAEGGVEEEKR